MPQEAACNLLLTQEGSGAVCPNEPAVGEGRREHTNVWLSTHICPAAPLRSTVSPEDRFYFLTVASRGWESSRYTDALHARVCIYLFT